MLINIYNSLVIKFSKINIFFFLLLFFFTSFNIKNFNLDASSDALLIEGDKDLEYLREVNDRYNSRDFLFLTYTPTTSFGDDETIINLLFLKSKIEKLEWVENVITIADVPLLKSSDKPLMKRLENFKNLSFPDIDKKRALNEILNSPIYKNYILSEDGKTSAIVVYLKKDEKLNNLSNIKNEYLKRINAGNVDTSDRKKFKEVSNEYENYKNIFNKKNQQNIKEIRTIINKYKENVTIHLGGIPMIANDMMTYIKNDIIIFGIGVFIFIVLILWYIFKSLRWVVIPLVGCLSSVYLMIGLLGLLNWKVTVISSNFIALMLILNMAMNIHLTVRYLQLRESFSLENDEAILLATKKMFLPIFYTALTTICAFLSLVFSEIKPVIDFGFMMTLGLLISVAITFLLVPSIIKTFSSDSLVSIKQTTSKITPYLANFAKGNSLLIFIFTILIIFFSIKGILKLEVENSFINYFDKDTEIYRGMKTIDNKLGGTTPLDVIIKFPKVKKDPNNEDDFEEWEENENDKSKYWFTKDKIQTIMNVHDYLDSLPEVGKVLSFASIIRVAEDLNGKPLQSLEIAVLNSKIPSYIKKEIISPYISVDDDEARITLRIKDSLENLKRDNLIKKINNELVTVVGLKEDNFKLTGVLILFNNLLQSLFKSQILTLGFVMLGIFIMFFILFKSFLVALLGVIPNFIAGFFILGVIGLLNIPLDMMTITIAAITIGIAVDNSIHYIYRFREEYFKTNDYSKTIDVCHSTVGVAILNTSVTIVFGFSILALSNFIPTIYFGLFTGLAMLLALISVLTLLPKMIMIVKPFGN